MANYSSADRGDTHTTPQKENRLPQQDTTLEKQEGKADQHVQRMATYSGIANAHSSAPFQRHSAPSGGLPSHLQGGIESLSGLAMDDVRVHYNSSKPAQLQAHAYAQGSDIHIAPGQERHLPHEAWHVVQQKQGRVKPTLQLKGIAINDDSALEREADVMGGRALSGAHGRPQSLSNPSMGPNPAQLVIDEKALMQKLQAVNPDWNPNFQDRTGALYAAILAYNADEKQATLAEVFRTRRRLKNKQLNTYGAVIQWLDNKLESEALRLAPAAPVANALQLPVPAPVPVGLNMLPQPVGANDEASDEDDDGVEEEAAAEVVDEKSAAPKAKSSPEFVTKEQGDVEAFRAIARVGLELTFQNADSIRYLTNQGFPNALKAQAVQWWQKMCNSWTNGLQAPDGWEVDVKDSGNNKDFGGGTGDQQMRKVTYTNLDDDETVIWWQLSMDPSVIEIQTSPTTADEMESGAMEPILAEIYKRAQQIGFEATGGGGHLNVDFATGFGGDFSLIPRVLMATEKMCSLLRESKDQLVDWNNESEDPFLDSKRYSMHTTASGAWDTYYDPEPKGATDHSQDWHSKVGKINVKDMPSLTKFRKAHAIWLLTHPSVAQYRKHDTPGAKITGKADEAGLSAALHYQAVNIDHLFEEVKQQRRVEFRFLKSQQSIQEIIDGIEIIAKIVSTASQMRK